MSDTNVKKVVGETFEDMSVTEMSMVQGAGDVIGEISTSPGCVAASASSAECAAAVSAISGAVSGAIVSIIKC